MPLPLIPVAIVIAGTLIAGKKGYDAYNDTQEAERHHRNAQKLYNKAQESLTTTKEDAQKVFEKLGKRQASIIEGSFKKYQNLIDKLEAQDKIMLKEVFGQETFEVFRTTQDSIASLQNTLGSLAAGSMAGAMAGFGAYGGAGLLASASTGTAISTLSGAAATNATLAWFGGGSLAAGGFGMAGGAWVLGGVVAAPALAVASFIFAKNAESKKYDAQLYYYTVKSLAEIMEGETLLWQEIRHKTKEKKDSLCSLDKELMEKIEIVTQVSNYKGSVVSQWDKQDHKNLTAMMQIAHTMQNMINAPILNDNDENTKKIIEHQKKCKELMDEIKQKWS
ncbi:hypothetical protein [Helicobacter sp. MIT 14-3879]|uniref:hypothetical protein n=1 Tax=Helicobacter sp. MIT 14-3879 TaxID=2040649 RepID=UPI000E1F3F5D|nr:hypothetical protein [Helicobacter sp. MIT 14-3879]RDU59865.1 hypothetical protein CQA44_11085 [Helicobacter sp. MIT 14-3879]